MPADPEIGLSSEWAIGLSAGRVIELSGHRVVELLDAKMYGELVAWIPWKCQEGLEILEKLKQILKKICQTKCMETKNLNASGACRPP